MNITATFTQFDSLNRARITTVRNYNPATNTTVDLTAKTDYDNPSNKTAATDALGVKVETETDGLGRAFRTTRTGIGGATSQTNYAVFDTNGQTVLAIDAMGNRTETVYDDSLLRATAATAFTGTNGTALTTRTYYFDKTNQAALGPTTRTTTFGANGQRSDSYADEVGWTTRNVTYTQNPPTDPNCDPMTASSSCANGSALAVRYEYDGRGNKLRAFDANNHMTAFQYENTNWLLGVDQTVGGATLQTRYTYDLVGNRIATQDANGHSTNATYDLMNHIRTERPAGFAAGDTYIYDYDGAGRMKHRTDPGSNSADFKYDTAGRQVSLTTLKTNTANSTITTTFAYNAAGLPTSMQDAPGGTTSYFYDAFNRVNKVESAQGVVQYGYDAANRHTSLDFGSDTNNLKHVGYTYDGLSRPIDISTWMSATPLHYEYAGSRLDHMDYPNGVTATYGYDDADRLTNITQAKGTATPLYAVTYELNTFGDRKKATESFSGVQHLQTYQYDELRRVTREATQIANGGQNYVAYTYDGVGNRTSANANGITSYYKYTDADWLHCISTSGSDDANCSQSALNTFDYNKNGSLTQQIAYGTGGSTTTTAYSYDSRNRLSQWVSGSGSTARNALFEYDGAGTRTRMQYTNAATPAVNRDTRYLQDATGMAEALQEINGSMRNSYFYAAGSTSPIGYDEAGTAYWYHHDGLGSVRATTTAAGTVQTVQSYSAFGSRELAFGNGVNDNPTLDKGTHGFAGEQSDPTGLSYNRARYYDPTLGRFIQRDTVVGDPSNPLSMNLFVYTQNNPTNAIDPSGNVAMCDHRVCGAPDPDTSDGPSGTNWTPPSSGTGVMPNPNAIIADAVNTFFNPPVHMFGPGYYKLGLLGMTTHWNPNDPAAADDFYDLYRHYKMGDLVKYSDDHATGFVDPFTNAPLDKEQVVANAVSINAQRMQALRDHPEFSTADIAEFLAATGIGLIGNTPTMSIRNFNNKLACSFSEETLVATDEGERQISDLKEDDYVIAYDEANGATGLYTIEAVHVHDDPAIEYLTLDNETLETTPEHPFYTQEGSFTPAGELRQGDHIRRLDGSFGVVNSIQIVQTVKRMYNLTVQHAHTFFVGKQRWLVHNTCNYTNIGSEVRNAYSPILPRRGSIHPTTEPSDIQISTGQKFNADHGETYIYVIDKQGQLRISKQIDPVSGTKHTQLVNAEGVYGAGEVVFGAQGSINSINTNSGRYMNQPYAKQFEPRALDFAKRLFEALGH